MIEPLPALTTVPGPPAPGQKPTALVVAHRWHHDAPLALAAVVDTLHRYGWRAVTEEDVDSGQVGLEAVGLAVVLGGDGTFLKAAEAVRGHRVPLLGINLGHVGFLAEADRADLSHAVALVAEGRYRIEERTTLTAHVLLPDGTCRTTWALNEATVEKATPEAMLEVALEVDGRPLSTFGCDGVVMATPTGSTAHAFSGGGPVVWPDVDALLVVPLCAHALFARPLVVSPRSVPAVRILSRSRSGGLLACDGRRTVDLPVGTRVEVRRDPEPVHLVRLDHEPFADRLVRKFSLPVGGWRDDGEVG